MTGLGKSLAVAVAAIAGSYAANADAGIFLKATDGANTRTANDSATPGIASYNGAIGNFTTSISIGAGFPAVGSLAAPVLDLTTLDLTTGTAGGALTVSLSETGFTGKTAATLFLSSITGIYNNSSAVMSTYFDTTDTPFGTGTLLSSGLVNNQSAAVSVPSISGPYSLTEILTITAGSNSLTSIDAAIVDAPEPPALSLIGLALLALGAVGWRSRAAGAAR
jgi:hypothetical protein